MTPHRTSANMSSGYRSYYMYMYVYMYVVKHMTVANDCIIELDKRMNKQIYKLHRMNCTSFVGIDMNILLLLWT